VFKLNIKIPLKRNNQLFPFSTKRTQVSFEVMGQTFRTLCKTMTHLIKIATF